MQYLFDNQFFNACFKHFSCHSSIKPISKIIYSNAIFQGETTLDIATSKPLANGLGLLFSSSGTIYYGKFEDNEAHGEGNLFFNNGALFRGSFKAGRAHGLCLWVLYSGDMFLMNFSKGSLEGNATFLPQGRPIVFQLLFAGNRFKNAVKSYDFPPEEYYKARLRILKGVFEDSQVKELLLNERDLHGQIRKLSREGLKVGSFEIGNSEFIFNGVFDTNLDFKGLGILIKAENRIEAGNFNSARLENFGMIFDKNYIYIGYFKNGEMNGSIIVRSLRKNLFKVCEYKEGAFVRVIKEGVGDPNEPIFKLKSFEQVSEFFLQQEIKENCFFANDYYFDFFEKMPEEFSVYRNSIGFENDFKANIGENRHTEKFADLPDDQKFTFGEVSREIETKHKKSDRSKSEIPSYRISNTKIRASPNRLKLKLKENSTTKDNQNTKNKRPILKVELEKNERIKFPAEPKEIEKLTWSKEAMLLSGEMILNKESLENGESVHKNVCWDFSEHFNKKKEFINENHFQLNKNSGKRFLTEKQNH